MRAWTWLSLLVLAGGCVGTDVGNPPGDDSRRSTLEFATVDTDVTGANALSTDGTQPQFAWLSVESVRVRPDCSGPPQRIEGPFYVELVSGEIQPGPVVVEGDYDEICSLSLDLGPAGDDAPAELVGLSALVMGEGADGPVMIESDTERALPYQGDGFELANDLRFIDAFDPSNWFAHADQGGSAVNMFFTALKQDSRIVKDGDDDGDVSRAEYIEPVALPQP